MDLGLDGRTALVTGASKGIGLGIAKALAGEGANVAISSRSRERIDAAAVSIGAHGYVHESADLDAIPAFVEQVESDLAPLDILVLSTGGPPPNADPLGSSREEWEATYRELILAPMAFIEAALPGMRERGFGRVLAVSSTSVREPIDPLMLSNSHRPGLVGAFKTISRQAAADGVTLNTILPGRIATDRAFENMGSRENAERAAAEQVPAGRLGTTEDIGAVAAFLCSDRASYVTGSTVAVDGGLLRSV